MAQPSIPDPPKRDALEVKAYGDEARAWGLAALAVKLNEAQGAYRCPPGSTAFFVSFGEVKLSKAPTARRPWWRFWG